MKLREIYIKMKKGRPVTAGISYCWQWVAVVITLGQALLTRPVSALNHATAHTGERCSQFKER